MDRGEREIECNDEIWISYFMKRNLGPTYRRTHVIIPNYTQDNPQDTYISIYYANYVHHELDGTYVHY